MNNKLAVVIMGILLLLLICLPGEAQLAGTPESIYVNKIAHTDLMVYGNLSHIKSIFGDPVTQNGVIFTIANLTVLDVLKQSNITPVNNGDTIPVFVCGGTIGNNTQGSDAEIMLQEGEGQHPAGIYCLFYDKDGRYQKDKYHIFSAVDRLYNGVKQDITSLSSGKVTTTELLDREMKKRENW